MPPTPPSAPLELDPSAWATALAEVPDVPVEALAPKGARLLLVSAHPDDETIGAGRLVADWAAHVGPVDAVVLSAGEACFGDTGEAARAVAETRIAEWEGAVTALGAVPHGCAHLPDHAVSAHEDVVAEVLEALLPAVDAVAVTWSGDPHPDHAAAGRAADRVCAAADVPLLPYLVWATYRLRPDDVDVPLTRVRTSDAADEARARALACYRSQLEPWPGRPPVVSPGMLTHHDRQLLVGTYR